MPDDRPHVSSSQIAGQGVFIAVVGPSGAGKDTLITRARDMLEGTATGADTHFIRRVITREADASVEDHDTLSEAEFASVEAAGAFAITWTAHGLRYGLPKEVDEVIAAGNVAVANGSRSAITQIAARYENIIVVVVTAPPEVLARRLSARGRESEADVLARLKRAADAPQIPGAVVIENTGAPEDAARKLVTVIEKAAARAALSGLV